MVRPGGRVAILEFFRPERPRFFFDTIYNGRTCCRWSGWAVTGDRDAYRYLPRLDRALRSRAEFGALLGEVGFAQVETRALFPSGVATLVMAS